MNAMGIMCRAKEHGKVIVFSNRGHISVAPYSETNWQKIEQKRLKVIGVYDANAKLEDIEEDLI